MVLAILLKVIFAIFSGVISVADIKSGAVPRLAFICAFPIFFIIKAAQEGIPPWSSIVGVLVGLFVFLLAFFISGKKLGLADVWYSGIIGLALGYEAWFWALCLACITGIAYILVFKKQQIPFIPFMAFGSITMSFVYGRW